MKIRSWIAVLIIFVVGVSVGYLAASRQTGRYHVTIIEQDHLNCWVLRYDTWTGESKVHPHLMMP